MNLKRFQEAATTLGKFLIGINSNKYQNGIIWYHAMCLDLLLDASITVVSYETCVKFYVEDMSKMTDMNREGSARFFANCMLWNMRHCCVDVAGFWKWKLMDIFEISKNYSVSGTYTGLRLMETLTLEVAYFISIKKDLELQKVERELKNVTKLVSAGVRSSNLFQERLKLHQLHLKMLKTFDEKKIQELKKLETSAIKNKDYLTVEIIKRTGNLWKNDVKSGLVNFWLHHSTEGDSLTVDRLCFSSRVFSFPLPLACMVIPEEGNSTAEDDKKSVETAVIID